MSVRRSCRFEDSQVSGTLTSSASSNYWVDFRLGENVMQRKILFASFAMFAVIVASAAAIEPAGRAKRGWGPEQVTGEPDTPAAGDQTTAWASATPDGADEWLELEYAAPVLA